MILKTYKNKDPVSLITNTLKSLALTIAIPREPLFIPLAEAFYPYDADIYDPNPFPSSRAYDLEPKNLASIFSCYAAMQRVADGM